MPENTATDETTKHPLAVGIVANLRANAVTEHAVEGRMKIRDRPPKHVHYFAIVARKFTARCPVPDSAPAARFRFSSIHNVIRSYCPWPNVGRRGNARPTANRHLSLLLSDAHAAKARSLFRW